VKLVSIIGIFLTILGFFGSLRFSSFFFGFFMVGLFLLIYSLIPQTKISPVDSITFPLPESTIQSTQQLSRFCSKCGAELDGQKDFCLFCGNKVRK
jgi:hypothetical protein